VIEMSREKMPYNQAQEDYSGNKLTDIHSSKPDASDLEKIKQTYLPESKASNKPSEESIEEANGLQSSKSLKPKSLI
jgi:hypothetical protein